MTKTTTAELPSYKGPNHYDEQAKTADLTATRRDVLIIGGSAAVLAATADYAQGAVEQRRMNHNPEAHIFENPDSNIVTVTIPGNRNDGLMMGSLLHAGAFGESNTVAVSYAEDNIDPYKLAALIKSSIESVVVPDPNQKKIVFYLNSISVAVTVPVFEILQSQGLAADLILIDSGIRSEAGLRGFNEAAARANMEKLGRMRFMNKIMKIFVGISIPPAAADKDPSVNLSLATEHRWRTVNADTITQCSQAAALEYPLKQDRLKGFARRLVYVKTDGTDPLVESELSARQIEFEYGQPVELMVDTDRSKNSHGNGPIWPKGLQKLFRSHFGLAA